MANDVHFTSIYRCSYLKSELPIMSAGPIRIEFFNGPTTISIPSPMPRVITQEEFQAMENGSATISSPTTEMELSEGGYFSINVSIPSNVEAIRDKAEMGLDLGTGMLALIAGSQFFAENVYRGCVIKGENSVVTNSGFLRAVEPFTISALAQSQLQYLAGQISKDRERTIRIRRMCKFLAKAQAARYHDEIYLYLWTMLEIWPMADTSDIAPISNLLAKRVGIDPQIIKQKLGIGRLFGYRSKLIHDGELPISAEEFGQTVAVLEAICIEVLFDLFEVPYRGGLDQFLKSSD